MGHFLPGGVNAGGRLGIQLGRLPGSPDPLAGISFLLRLQNKFGSSNTPYQVFKNTAATTPATVAGDVEQAWADVLSGSGLVATQVTSLIAPKLDFLSSIPQNVFDGTDSWSLPIASIAGDFDIFVVGTRASSVAWIPLANAGDGGSCLMIFPDNHVYAVDGAGNLLQANYTGSAGVIGARWTRVSGVIKFEATGMSQITLGTAGVNFAFNSIGNRLGTQTVGNHNAILATSDTSKGTVIKTYLNSLYNCGFTP